MSGQIFEAKTVQEALDKAAESWGVAAAELEHEVVEEKTDDFWGLGAKVLCVRVWRAESAEPEPDAQTPDAQPPAESPGEPAVAPAAEPEPNAEAGPTPDQEPDAGTAEPAARQGEPRADGAPAAAAQPPADAIAEPVTGGDLVQDAERLLGHVFAAMGFDCEAKVEREGEAIQIAISGQDKQYLLEGRGRGLSALELVLNHAFRHRLEGARPKFRVDAGDFRSQRDEELRDLAYQVAHRAKETGEVQQTRALNPYERRIVHLTLADDASVSTRSEGSGFEKVVSVIPRRGGRR